MVYQPSEFTDVDPEHALDHIARYPLGLTVSSGDERLEAAHLPYFVDTTSIFAIPESTTLPSLVSHFAVRNQQMAALTDGAPVLVVFSGPDAYVSPAHYVQEPDVPTWNYTTVHVHGRYHRIDPEKLRTLLDHTVDRFENPNGAHHGGHGWSTRQMDPAELKSLARAVIGFTVSVTEITAGFKLSQDKLGADVDAVMEGLELDHAPLHSAVAAEMRRFGVTGRTDPPSTDPRNWMS